MRAEFHGETEVERGGAGGSEWNEGEEIADANVARIAQRKNDAALREEAEGDREVGSEAGIFFDEQAGGDGLAEVCFGEAEVGGAAAL